MAFLDYLLGGVSGGFEGYERKKARELQAQKDEEERQFRKLTLLDQFDFRPTGLVDQGAAPGARNTVADISANLPKPISDTKLGSAFEAARQRGFGIEPPPASPLTSPVSLALDTTKGRQPEQPPRMPQTGPEIQVNTPFGRMGFTRDTEEQKLLRELKRFEAQQDFIEKRRAAENDRANRGYFAILQRAGEIKKDVKYDDVKDIDLKSAYDELKQQRSLTSAMQRAQVAGQYGTYLPGVVGPDGQPQIMFGTRGGSITPTGVAPVQAASTNIPDSDRRSMTELEASIKELDNALEATNKNPNAFGLKTVLPNIALTRQGGVKARADVTGAIVKLRRTEFGTAMSKQEKESGLPLFPAIGGISGGDDADTIKEKLTALREKAILELNTKREFYGMPTYDASVGAAPAAPAPARTLTAAPAKAPAKAQTLGQWMDANPQRQGETDAQYEARYKASVKGGR